MKKLILALLFLLLSCPVFAENQQLARMSPWVAGSVVAPTNACDTGNSGSDFTGSTYGGAHSIGETDDNYFIGQGYFQPNFTQCVCKITIEMSSSGDISGKTYYMKIWAATGAWENLPTNYLAKSSGVTGDNAWSGTLVEFSFSTCVNMSASSYYHITIDQDGAASDATNFASLHMNEGTYASYRTMWKKDKSIDNDNTGNDSNLTFYW